MATDAGRLDPDSKLFTVVRYTFQFSLSYGTTERMSMTFSTINFGVFPSRKPQFYAEIESPNFYDFHSIFQKLKEPK